MAQQTIGSTRLAQRTSGAAANANFGELYGYNTLISNAGKTAAGSFVVPAGYTIASIAVFNNTANAVTGGLKFGKTAGAADVVAAQAVGANAAVVVADSALLLRVFSKTVDQTVYFDAVTAWNSANVDINVFLRKMV